MRYFRLDVIRDRMDGDLYAFRLDDADDPYVTWLDAARGGDEREIDIDESGVYLEVVGAFSITLV